MTIYDPKFEHLLVDWYYQLSADPEEFAKLFSANLRSLTMILSWAAGRVRLFFSTDTQGIWAAAWLAPDTETAAFAGAWIRRDKRGSLGSVAFINQFYRAALEDFPCIIGITKQPELHDLHLRLGYVEAGVLPHYFDGDDARVYVLTRESRAQARSQSQEVQANVSRRKQEQRREQRVDAESVGEVSPEAVGEALRGNGTPARKVHRASNGSAPDRRRQRAHPDHQPKRGRRTPKPRNLNGRHPPAISP